MTARCQVLGGSHILVNNIVLATAQFHNRTRCHERLQIVPQCNQIYITYLFVCRAQSVALQKGLNMFTKYVMGCDISVIELDMNS